LTAAGYEPCIAQAMTAIAGTPVWSARLEWGLVSGTSIQDRYGAGGGEMGSPAPLTVRKAAAEYVCRDCRHLIARGALHGSGTGSHYCACCVTTVQPDSQFKRKAA
jgi:hypothetical protein